MKIVVIGGTGLIGSNVVRRLRAQGHETLAASPNTGVNTLTGDGLAEALENAEVVIDVSNSPSFADEAVMAFFETSSQNLLTAATQAGVRHYLALSVVGADRMADSGYMRAKVAQEKQIRASTLPYTILRATQFFQFIEGIVNAGAQGDTIRLSPALIQPIAADDVAAAIADLALGAPANGMAEIGGPDLFPLDELGRTYLTARGDRRQVIADVHARYFGSELDDRSLVAGTGARIGATRFQDWLKLAAA